MANRFVSVIVAAIAAVLLIGSVAHARGEDVRPRVAMVLWRGMTRAEEGFIDRLLARAVDVRLKVFDARQDRQRLDRYLKEEFRPEDFDYVYTFGTTVSVRAAEVLQGRVPQIFNIVAYPVQAGLVECMGGSGRNICGVSNSVSMSSQLNYARTMVKFRKVGVLFTPTETNACEAAGMLERIAEEQGIQVVRFPAGPGDKDLDAALADVTDREDGVDVVYLPTDSGIASRGREIGKALKAGGMPSIAALESMVDEGALLGLVPQYYDLGSQAADILCEHLDGRPLGEIPVERPRSPRPVINMKTARALGVDVHPEIRKEAVAYE